jgi:mono/diheme cytochrome c family protein
MRLLRIVLAALLASCAPSALAQATKAPPKGDFGRREYDSNCANCHGPKGKGDGVYKPYLTKSPSDLSTLAKANGGVFPFDRVYRIVDGREPVAGHSTADMPIWGADYYVRSIDDYIDVPYDPELYVRTRILALLEHISRLQVK